MASLLIEKLGDFLFIVGCMIFWTAYWITGKRLKFVVQR